MRRILWSISTTVRSPERLHGFLRVLKQIEGQTFSKETQIMFQVLLIKERLYRPKNIPEKYKEEFDDLTRDLPYDIAEDIFRHQHYEDPPMRGRQSVNPLNKLGFCIAKEALGPIRITELGNMFLTEDTDISYVLFKSLLKLEYPNPISPDFSEEMGFNIRPMIATMHLIQKAGFLTQEEFSIFVPTLINHRDIGNYLIKINELRNLKEPDKRKKYISTFLKDFYETRELSKTQENNSHEYGDNTMRYFRLTKYFRVVAGPFGAWKIYLEQSRKKEIEQVLSRHDGSAIKFSSIEEYIEYMADMSRPELPWELDKEKSTEVILSVKNIIKEQYDKGSTCLKNTFNKKYNLLMQTNFEEMALTQRREFIQELRNLRIELIQFSKDIAVRKNVDALKQYIQTLQERKQYRNLDPADIEFLISQCFKIINDEIEIKPNCVLDDEGNPIGHAPGNRADIEAYYQSFNNIFEVTLDVSRHQVYRESIPVMRHLRNFEDNNPGKENYCIFIAPKIHNDTVNYFWIAVKYGYEGTIQRIVALSFDNFIEILHLFIDAFENGKPFSHQSLKILYESIVALVDDTDSSIQWMDRIPTCINTWKLSFNQRN